MDQYVVKDGKKLRMGYTTGSCAAAAAKAAAWMLLTGKPLETIRLLTPKGIPLELEVLEREISPDMARCAIRKDSGDDPDVTDKTLISPVDVNQKLVDIYNFAHEYGKR